jgi:hypothetical protein
MSFSLATIDRRFVYLLILIALVIPLALKVHLTPAPMRSAQKFFDVVEAQKAEKGTFVLLVFDFGPNSKAENFPQTEVVVEHLMRRRIPFAVYSQYLQAEPLLESIPAEVAARLSREDPSQTWEYGKDWANLGYRVGGALFIQGLVRAERLGEVLKKDARGNDIATLPLFHGVLGIKSISLLAQFSSLTGTLETILQFFQTEEYRPPLLHGCTSITIPAAYIFLDSGQMVGLLEGIAGAASYSALLDGKYPGREPDRSTLMMTGLGVAHLVIIGLVILGNIAAGIASRRKP